MSSSNKCPNGPPKKPSKGGGGDNKKPSGGEDKKSTGSGGRPSKAGDSASDLLLAVEGSGAKAAEAGRSATPSRSTRNPSIVDESKIPSELRNAGGVSSGPTAGIGMLSANGTAHGDGRPRLPEVTDLQAAMSAGRKPPVKNFSTWRRPASGYVPDSLYRTMLASQQASSAPKRPKQPSTEGSSDSSQSNKPPKLKRAKLKGTGAANDVDSHGDHELDRSWSTGKDDEIERYQGGSRTTVAHRGKSKGRVSRENSDYGRYGESLHSDSDEGVGRPRDGKRPPHVDSQDSHPFRENTHRHVGRPKSGLTDHQLYGPPCNRLPRALRNHIYGYIIDPDFVVCRPRPGKTVHSAYEEFYGRAHTYDFQSRTLSLVNRATRLEIRENLESNTFILVDYKMPGFRRLFYLCNVPFVRDSSVGAEMFDNCNIHSVHMKLEWDKPPIIRLFDGHHSMGEDIPEQGSFLIIMRDLPKLCGMLKFLCQYSFPMEKYVVSDRGVKAVFSGERPVDLLRMGIKVVDRELNVARRTTILKYIQAITGGGYCLHLIGFPELPDMSPEAAQMRALVTQVRQSMAPRLIWLRAMQWDQLNIALQIKKSADKLALQGDYWGAIYRYKMIVEYAVTVRLRQLENFFPPSEEDEDEDDEPKSRNIRDLIGEVAQIRLRLLKFDLGISIMTCYLFLPGTGGGYIAAPYAHLHDEDKFYSHKMRLQLRHVKILRRLHDLAMSPLVLVDEAGALNEFIKYHNNSTVHDESYVDHDAELLKRELGWNRPKQDSPKIFSIVNKLSIHAQGFRVFDSQGEVEKPEVRLFLRKQSPALEQLTCKLQACPAALRGWQDIDHLKDFSEEDIRGHPTPGSIANPGIQNYLSRLSPSSSRPILPPPSRMALPPPNPKQHAGPTNLRSATLTNAPPVQGHCCPVKTCKRHREPFDKAWKWRKHLKASHKYGTDQVQELESSLKEGGK